MIYINHDFTIVTGISLWTVTAIRVLIAYASASVLTWKTSTVIDYILAPGVCVADWTYAKKVTWSCVHTCGTISAHSSITFIYWNGTVNALIAGRADAIKSAHR